MGRRTVLVIAALPFLAAASAPVPVEKEPVDIELARARAEAKTAEADLNRLEQAAANAKSEAEKLATERQAAAAAVAASEAEISAADAQLRLAEALVAQRTQKLAEQQAPVTSLLAGIINMGRRPPLLSIADSSSVDELVRVRALLDTTIPVIRQRSAALAAELAQGRKLQASAAAARSHLTKSRQLLAQRQQHFAELESKAYAQAARIGVGLVGASDTFIATAESETRLLSEGRRRQRELQLAAELGGLPPAPARPGTAKTARPALPYILPVDAPVIDGLGSVSDTGIRSRGLTLRSYRGQKVVVPADGTVAFAGPFRRHDGVVIIDHGKGWMSLMTGVRAEIAKGEKVETGQPLGRAMGPVTVELSTNGTPISAALIARSSQIVSNRAKSG